MPPKYFIAVVLVDVDLPYWTSKVEHLIALAAIFSNILLRIRRNGYLWTSSKIFDTIVMMQQLTFKLTYKGDDTTWKCAMTDAWWVLELVRLIFL